MSDEAPQNTQPLGNNEAFAAQVGKGRPKGAANKSTRLMKDAIAAVYADLQDSIEEADNANAHFLQWAKDNSTEFYKLAAKLIPIQIAGDEENPLKHIHQIALVPVMAKHSDS